MKTKWDITLNLKDCFHNDQMTFEQRRDAIVSRIEDAPWYKGFASDSVHGESLEDIVHLLKWSDDSDEFNEHWDTFYDWCDAGKMIWVDTGQFG